MNITRKLATAAVTLGIAASAVIGTTTTASANPNASYIGYGYSEYGTGVWCVQHILNHNGEYYAGIAEDSYWGPKTEAAVKEFQRQVKSHWPSMEVDGIVGPSTGWWLLYMNNDGYGYNRDGSKGACWNHVPTSY
ncbi:peptidoglycan-binding protein [Kitasatospora sp. NPDC127111]|uniref:peptidoglycan-binding domain-containing protein n=1 Tax=Kitasatospora sp. NPDC127111 TaxID=3345363 RepID=UPI0036388C8F